MSKESVEKYRLDCKTGDTVRDAGLRDPEDVIRYDDIAYGPDPMNVLDVYLPEGTERKKPVIVSVHGGGWVYGDKELYSHYCLRLAQRGFAVVNFSYRLAPEHKYPAGLEDCFAVFRWIRENHGKYYLDYDNMFMVGDSAGGQMAFQCLTILSSPEYAKLFDFGADEDFKIRACALNCGVYILPVSRRLKAGDAFFMGDYLPEDYETVLPQLSAFSHVTKDFPPAFVMTSYGDFLRFMARPLYLKLRSKGVEAEYHIYGERNSKRIGHVFHLNCRSNTADLCNDEECAFFHKHRKI